VIDQRLLHNLLMTQPKDPFDQKQYNQDPFNHHKSPEKKIRSMGHIMMLAAWVLFFGLLTMFFSSYMSPKVEGRITSTGVRVLTLHRNNYNQYLSTGKVNGQNVIYLIDTGATGVSIPPSVAKRAGLKRGRTSTIYTANGIGTVYSTRIKSLEIGPIVIKNIRGHINPGLTDNKILLGMRVLRKLDIRLKGNTMTLRQGKR